MAPKKTESTGSQPLKQSTLSFASAKRTKSASSAKGQKPKTTTPVTQKPASATDSLGRSDEEPIESFSEETDGPPPPKKQKIKSVGVNRRETGVVNSGQVGANDHLEELDFKDKKWGRHYKGVKQQMHQMTSVQTIHGQGQTAVHEILRVFDLSYKYGPCVGVSRLDRWKRAEALGMNPPPEVYEILRTKQGVEQQELSQSVFYEEV